MASPLGMNTQLSLEQEKSEQNDLTQPEDEGPKITPMNIANGLCFFAGVAVVCICQFTPWLGRTLSGALTEHATILSAKHANWDNMFLVWVCIFTFEAIFVLAQFSGYRDHAIVKKISFWWVVQCMLQIAYFVQLILDILPIWVTAGLLVANFTILMLIIAIIENNGKQTFLEFWMLRAPFSMHAGYLLCESIAWVNILLQVREENGRIVIATSMTGVTAVLALITVLAIAVPRPDGLFCFGVSYTYFWVSLELLCNPDAPDNNCLANIRQNLTPAQVSDATLEAFHFAALSISFIAGCLGLLAFGLRVAACCQRGRV